MRLRRTVITILAGVTAIAGPAAAMELATPSRPTVAPAAKAPAPPPPTGAAKPATTVPVPTTAVRKEQPPPTPVPTTAVRKEPPPPKPVPPVETTVKPVVVEPVKQTLRFACAAGRPDGSPAVRCEWSAAAGAARYVLYRKSNDGTEAQRIWSGTDLSAVDKAVAEGATYSYGVKALDGVGKVIGFGGPTTLRCCGDVAPPVEPKPSALRFACAAGWPDGSPAVRCQWSAAAGAARYVLYRKSGDGTEPQRIWSGTDLSAVDKAVADGATYGYAVKALDGSDKVIGFGGVAMVSCCPSGEG